ncbi:hypothetical protein DRQ25_05540 [Candidatus Fermentibacteria bacterium]|nr:MAG: hypothetical protein DRQ25_05540 [Candidatus Fermentibacteria bacterium]
MKNIKWFIPFVAIIAIMIAISCGDDENPAGPGDNPTASTLSATSGTTNTVFASWSACPDNDFSEYNLYRSATSGISGNPPSTPIRTSSNVSDTTFSDTGLSWGETYYYAVQTKNTGSNTAWSNEVQVVIADSGSSSGYLTCYDIQGQAASSPYDDQIVSVTGIVTTGGDELYSTTGAYAFISDAGGGPWSGLILYGDSVAALVRGDSITISGTVDEFYGLTELTFPTDVQVISTGHTLPDAIELTTAQACEEQYESVVISVTDAIVLVANANSYEIDDGSGSCHMGTRGSITEPSVSDTVDVTGPLFYEYDEWRIQPRDNNDITIHGGGGGNVYTCYEIQGQQETSPFNGQTVSVTGIVTADPDDYTAVSSSTYGALADAGGGPWSGLLMYGDDLAGLVRGDSVTVTGVVDEYFGVTELKYPISYVVHSSGHSLPAPEQMITGDLATAVTPEQWESVFVTVTDLDVTQIGLPYYTWAIDDGSGECYAGTMGDFTYVPAVGDTISSFTGLLWYSRDNYKIEPRDDSDIII